MLEVGSIVDGKYKILNLIGRGGMSNVYLAVNEKVNKTWAIKEVRKEEQSNLAFIKQSLVVEMELLKKLNHPNLPQIIDVIEERDNLLIVMEYIEGITLEESLKKEKVIEQNDMVKYSIQLCDVLDYLHHQTPPIIYRDMKPSNIMLKSDGNVVLIDFGTAREYKNDKMEDTTCLGTRGYAAPEQFGGMGQTDERTDIYNLGATMYHLVTGHNPATPPYEMYPIRKWNEGLSSGLEYIIEKCTIQNPEERYQSIDELRYALQNFRKFDESAIIKYRKNLKIFFCFLVATFLCLFSSIFLGIIGNFEENREYSSVMAQARKMTSEEEIFERCLAAITMNPTRDDAYQMIYETIIEDGVMSEEEEAVILKICTNTEDAILEYEKKNPKGYADFCYNCANAYWYYYIHKEGRQTHAVNWFETAVSYYKENQEKEVEYRRSQLYLQIGKFYKKILAAQIEGKDAGMYGEFWNNMVELKRMNDENQDRELVTLYLYEEIVTKSMEYARYFIEDGVMREDILSMYSDIATDLKMKKENAHNRQLEEINYIEKLIVDAEHILKSNV